MPYHKYPSRASPVRLQKSSLGFPKSVENVLVGFPDSVHSSFLVPKMSESWHRGGLGDGTEDRDERTLL